MPRLPNSLLRRASHDNPLLPLLLKTCRDFASAHNELRWLREHALTSARARPSQRAWRDQLHQLCVERSRGKPLQYILGNQPFGDLDIICKPGVLIPRSVSNARNLVCTAKNKSSPETEAYTSHLANLLSDKITPETAANRLSTCPQLRILDLCTGTGCIPLLLHAIISPSIPDLRLHGVDISGDAVALSNQNLRWNIRRTNLQQTAKEQVQFSQGNIFHDSPFLNERWDIVVSNPPYISPRSFVRNTCRSVRNFEPKTALVPPDNCVVSSIDGDALKWDLAIGDAFYPRLLEIAKRVDAKLLLAEVADMEQAKRVVALAVDSGHWNGYKIWKDWPNQGVASKRDTVEIGGKTVEIHGEGHGRSVFLSRTG